MPQPNRLPAVDPHSIEATLNAVLGWARSQDFLGYEKHDGLNSPLLYAAAGWARWPRILAVQAVMRSPLNLRPLLGVRKSLNPKGLALFIRAHLDLARLGDAERHLAQAREHAATLLRDQTGPGLQGRGWGYHYPWQDLAFFAPPRTPNAVVTAFVCDALLRLHDSTREADLVRAVDAAVPFFLQDLPRLKDTGDELCLGYMPMPMRMRVMDVSALVAVVLARHARVTGRAEHLPTAARLMRFVVRQQTAEGAWYYTDPPEDSPVKIDNYHTGFIVDALRDYIDLTGDHAYEPAHQRGLRFYAERLFNADGAPRWMSDVDFPHDVHGAAQGIITFSRHRDAWPGLADRIAGWALEHLYSGDGWFHHQQRRGYRTPYTLMRWCNAWMARALAAWLVAAREAR